MVENSDKNKQYLKFARLVVSGMGITAAYREIVDCESMTDSAVRTAASRFATNVNILKFVKELRELKDESTELTVEWRMVVMSRKAEEAAMKGDWRNLIKAIDMLNRMDGGAGGAYLRFTIYDLRFGEFARKARRSGAGAQRNFWNKARNRLERCRRSQATEAGAVFHRLFTIFDGRFTIWMFARLRAGCAER